MTCANEGFGASPIHHEVLEQITVVANNVSTRHQLSDPFFVAVFDRLQRMCGSVVVIKDGEVRAGLIGTLKFSSVRNLAQGLIQTSPGMDLVCTEAVFQGFGYSLKVDERGLRSFQGPGGTLRVYPHPSPYRLSLAPGTHVHELPPRQRPINC